MKRTLVLSALAASLVMGGCTLFPTKTYQEPTYEQAAKDKFLAANREKFREAAGRKEVDDVFRNKYTAHLGQIIQGYAPNTTKDNVTKIWDEIAALDIADTDGLALYRDIATVKVVGEGQDELYRTIVSVIPDMADNEKNMVLYYSIIFLKDLWTENQTDELLGYVTNESTKGYITRSINR